MKCPYTLRCNSALNYRSQKVGNAAMVTLCGRAEDGRYDLEGTLVDEHAGSRVPTCKLDWFADHVRIKYNHRYMSTLYFLRGLPGSGNNHLGSWEAHGSESRRGSTGFPHEQGRNRKQLGAEDGSRENDVIRVETQLVTAALEAGLDVIMDNTHFNPKYERKYRRLSKKYGYAFELKFFDLPVGNVFVETRRAQIPWGSQSFRPRTRSILM